MFWRRRPNVHKLARKGRTKRLVAALSYSDHLIDRLGRVYDLGTSVRRDAALALATVAERDDVDVGTALMRSLGDPSAQVRSAAANALAARRDRRAVPALTEAALTWNGRYESARAGALEALSTLAGPDTARTVVTTLVERGSGMGRAADILGATINGSEAVSAQAVMAALLAVSQRHGPAAERAAEILVWLGSESVEPLIGVLDGGTRSLPAIRALGRLRDLRATDSLVRLLSEDNPDVRQAAAEALGDVSDPRARGPLLEASGDLNYRVRETALNALQRIGALPLSVEVGAGRDRDSGF
jgi:HEAT repeat protein